MNQTEQLSNLMQQASAGLISAIDILHSSRPIVGSFTCPHCEKPEDTLNAVVYFLYTEHGWNIERIDAWLKDQEEETA